jgi:hypothetical protein
MINHDHGSFETKEVNQQIILGDEISLKIVKSGKLDLTY